MTPISHYWCTSSRRSIDRSSKSDWRWVHVFFCGRGSEVRPPSLGDFWRLYSLMARLSLQLRSSLAASSLPHCRMLTSWIAGCWQAGLMCPRFQETLAGIRLTLSCQVGCLLAVPYAVVSTIQQECLWQHMMNVRSRMLQRIGAKILEGCQGYMFEWTPSTPTRKWVVDVLTDSESCNRVVLEAMRFLALTAQFVNSRRF